MPSLQHMNIALDCRRRSRLPNSAGGFIFKWGQACLFYDESEGCLKCATPYTRPTRRPHSYENCSRHLSTCIYGSLGCIWLAHTKVARNLNFFYVQKVFVNFVTFFHKTKMKLRGAITFLLN